VRNAAASIILEMRPLTGIVGSLRRREFVRNARRNTTCEYSKGRPAANPSGLRACLAAVALLVALLALPQTALAACTRAPADGAYFVTDREPVGGDQLFSGERGLTKGREAIVTRGVIMEQGGGYREQRCSSEKAFFTALSQSFAPKGARQVLLYIHGYYTTFRTGIKEGLAIRRGLHFTGPLGVCRGCSTWFVL